MKKIYAMALTLLCGLFVTGAALAADWGEIRVAKSNLNVREGRSPKTEHVLTLAKGQRVKVDFLKEGWVAVFNLNEPTRDESRAIGYANDKYLERVEAAPQAAPKSEEKPVVAEAEGEGEVVANVASAPPSATENLGVDSNRIPVKISADRMVYDESGKVVSFVGNVVAEHGGLTLWADKLSAYLSSSTGKKFSADSIDRIVADGNVRAKKGKSEGEAGRVTYFVAKQILKMEQNPKLQDGPNSLTGDVINFYVRENRSEVIGGNGQRVKAIFMAPSKLKVQ
ncbi:lipopolysaccharide transport periplasmic protein LptA [Pseudodesulfovibrio cashew]|uniref:Lipopolysaccharide transport periplasmic protein LptA n=1 Tax=Pseudodesulfovibrio cashew TaxID=2678688 RepID=A0A6I6JJ14_9BACT|nr:lipopolysaccharide transport periplasmic protein LptA [Pseudodesulfovibrio cashew]QGY41129.1 lipopolysaccharide transport periplasmic protein LptA [Pseudodesulfovibrio cashew]